MAKGSVTPQMNVTPLVDVVLVLLIIFMVITPLLTKNFWVHVPKQEKEEVTRDQLQQDPTPPLVLHVGGGRAIQVNGADVGFDELTEPPDMDVDGPRLDVRVATPDEVEKLHAAVGAVGVANEEAEELEGAQRETRQPAADGDLVRVEVHRQPAARVHVVRRRIVQGGAAPQNGADARHELARAERL